MKFIVYGNRKNRTPSESSYDFMCELPNENPEDAFCGPDALRDAYRQHFYSGYLSFFETQRESLDLWNFLSNSSQSRCSRALFSAAHPFTCHFTTDQIGRYIYSYISTLHLI